MYTDLLAAAKLCVLCFVSYRVSGADELLPILSYVIIRTQRPELAVECFALMDFIDER